MCNSSGSDNSRWFASKMCPIKYWFKFSAFWSWTVGSSAIKTNNSDSFLKCFCFESQLIIKNYFKIKILVLTPDRYAVAVPAESAVWASMLYVFYFKKSIIVSFF